MPTVQSCIGRPSSDGIPICLTYRRIRSRHPRAVTLFQSDLSLVSRVFLLWDRPAGPGPQASETCWTGGGGIRVRAKMLIAR